MRKGKLSNSSKSTPNLFGSALAAVGVATAVYADTRYGLGAVEGLSSTWGADSKELTNALAVTAGAVGLTAVGATQVSRDIHNYTARRDALRPNKMMRSESGRRWAGTASRSLAAIGLAGYLAAGATSTSQASNYSYAPLDEITTVFAIDTGRDARLDGTVIDRANQPGYRADVAVGAVIDHSASLPVNHTSIIIPADGNIFGAVEIRGGATDEDVARAIEDINTYGENQDQTDNLRVEVVQTATRAVDSPDQVVIVDDYFAGADVAEVLDSIADEVQTAAVVFGTNSETYRDASGGIAKTATASPSRQIDNLSVAEAGNSYASLAKALQEVQMVAPEPERFETKIEANQEAVNRYRDLAGLGLIGAWFLSLTPGSLAKARINRQQRRQIDKLLRGDQ